MTPEELRRYRKVVVQIEALDAQIEAEYCNIQSPKFDKNDTGKLSATVPNSPVEQSLARIEEFNRRRSALVEFKQYVDYWVRELDDNYIASIITYHYLLGYKWDKTATLIHGESKGDTCRKAVQRYFDTYKV